MKTIQTFSNKKQKKQKKQKIKMVTCYDYTSATILDGTQIDCVLVGDSGSMVMQGHPDTTHATLEEMVWMTKSVARGIRHKFIIADLPFMSYRQSLPITVQSVTQLIQAGAQAVKLEGTDGNLETIAHLVASGVPVMGHVGLTPQFVHGLGGFKVQGKTQAACQAIVEQAKQLASAGCFAIVLECIPWQLARDITEQLEIPTIGIGAGPATDGQVLVLQDMLGLQRTFQPKFVKTYLQGADLFTESINQYAKEVEAGEFPGPEHCFEAEVLCKQSQH